MERKLLSVLFLHRVGVTGVITQYLDWGPGMGGIAFDDFLVTITPREDTVSSSVESSSEKDDNLIIIIGAASGGALVIILLVAIILALGIE